VQVAPPVRGGILISFRFVPIFHAMADNAAPTVERRATRPRQEPRAFDPRRPVRLSAEHRRALSVVTESFAHRMTTVLATRLRCSAHVTFGTPEQVTYAEFMLTTPDPAALAVLALGPTHATGVLRLELPLAMTTVDRLLGGTGVGPHPERALSDIEQRLLRSILDPLAAELGLAFAPVVALDPAVVRQESKPQLVRGASPDSTMVVVDFEVMLGDEGGIVTLCVPLAAVEPSLDSFSGSSLGVDVDARADIAGALLDVPVDVSVQFQPVGLASSEILDLIVGDVIPLRHSVDAPLTLVAAGVRTVSAMPGRRGRRLACVVVDPDQENPSWPS
jgi:flagellar motor switch protein FliM